MVLTERRSYDYAHRRGVREVTWDDVTAICRRLAEELDRLKVDAIIGIARGGLLPATLIALMLRRDLFPVRLSRRQGDQVVSEHPVWSVPVGPYVQGRRVAVIDEMSDTGETLAEVGRACSAAGADFVICAALFSHSWAQPRPGVVGVETDELVVCPWDRAVLVDQRWMEHPEITLARSMQIEPHPPVAPDPLC